MLEYDFYIFIEERHSKTPTPTRHTQLAAVPANREAIFKKELL